MDFGDRRMGDRVVIQEDLGPNSEYEAACDMWGEILLGDILQDLERLEGELLAMREESQELEKMGMYPAVPSESWQPRNGKGSYLRMIMPRGTPGVPRKLYVGNKPEKIAEARRLAARRQRWEELAKAIKNAEYFLNGIRVELSGISRRVERMAVAAQNLARLDDDLDQW